MAAARRPAEDGGRKLTGDALVEAPELGKELEKEKGFALPARPAIYGAPGIMSFIVNRDGVVFQKGLGPPTASRAGVMKLVDPDLSRAKVDVGDGVRIRRRFA